MTNIFRHSGSMGDIIYSLPAIQAKGGGILYLSKKLHFDNLKRLLEIQPYIQEVREGIPDEGTDFIDMDDYRDVYDSHRDWNLIKCHAELLGVKVNYQKPWLYKIKSKHYSDVIVNKTFHYSGEGIDYKILKDYDFAFIGNSEEYSSFFKQFCDIDYLDRVICSDALEIAQYIAGSKVFVGNQSLCFAIAEGLKHTRFLEVCKERDNCRIPCANMYVSLHKSVLNGYVKSSQKMENWIIVKRLAEVVLSHVKGCIVEIGIGESTPILAELALRFKRRHYACDVLTSKWNNFQKLGVIHEYMHKFHCKSFRFMKHFNDKPAIVFIDGNHHYDTVSKEAEFFIDRMPSGAMAFFHDMFIPDYIFEKYKQKGKEYDTYKCRQEIEKRKDVYTMSFPYTAANAGLTIVLKKESNPPFHRQ